MGRGQGHGCSESESDQRLVHVSEMNPERPETLRKRKQGGIIIYENGKGMLDDNDIFGNALAGVEVRTGADPVLRRNRISKNQYQGIWVREGSGGTFEENDLRGNEKGPWLINADSVNRVVKRGNIDA